MVVFKTGHGGAGAAFKSGDGVGFCVEFVRIIVPFQSICEIDECGSISTSDAVWLVVDYRALGDASWSGNVG